MGKRGRGSLIITLVLNSSPLNQNISHAPKLPCELLTLIERRCRGHCVWCVWRSYASPWAPWAYVYILYHPRKASFVSRHVNCTLSLVSWPTHTWTKSSANLCNECVDIISAYIQRLGYCSVCKSVFLMAYVQQETTRQEKKRPCVYVYILPPFFFQLPSSREQNMIYLLTQPEMFALFDAVIPVNILYIK